MKKSKNVIDEYLSKIDLNKLREGRLKYKNSLTLAYQFGYSIGEVVSFRVPVLSCDWLKTQHVIDITEEEMIKHESTCEDHSNASKDKNVSKEEVDNLLKIHFDYRIELRKKYLPETFETFVKIINVSDDDMIDFKKGMSSALWNSDRCLFSNKPEDIIITDEENLHFTKISLKYLGD